MTFKQCNSDGGTGIGAGHVCRCNRAAGHLTDDMVRSHGCSCGAAWADVPLTRHAGGGIENLPGAKKRLEDAQRAGAEWAAVLERRREARKVPTNPQWLIDLAQYAYDELSALPPSAQPIWFRLHYEDEIEKDV